MGRTDRDRELRAAVPVLGGAPERHRHEAHGLLPRLDLHRLRGDGDLDLAVDGMALVLDPARAVHRSGRRIARLREDPPRRRARRTPTPRGARMKLASTSEYDAPPDAVEA